MKLAQVPVTARLSFLTPVLGMAAWATAGAHHTTAVLLTWIVALTFIAVASTWAMAFVARRFGADAQVDLTYLGGMVRSTGDAELTVRQWTLAHLASPAVGVALGAVAFAVGAATTASVAHTIASEFTWVAIAYTASTLLPMPDLIGGQLVRFAAWALFPYQTNRIIAVVAVLGLVAWLVVGTWFECWPMLIFVMLYLWVRDPSLRGFYRDLHDERLSHLRIQFRDAANSDDMARTESLGLRLIRELASDEQRAFVIRCMVHRYNETGRLDVAQALFDSVPEGSSIEAGTRGFVLARLGRFAEAVPYFRRAFAENVRDEEIRGYLIRALTRSGQHDEALELAYAGAEDTPGRLRLEAALFYAGRFSAALELSEQLWNQTHEASRAYNAACSASRLGEHDYALIWLERAVADGYDDLAHLESDDDLAAIAERPEFAVLKQRIKDRHIAS